MKTQPLYRLEIAPIVIMPLTRTTLFSYLSSEAVAVGSYVTIPFGKRSTQGIVFRSTPFPGRAPQWMKFVGKTIEKQFLTTEQLQLAEYVSEEYFTPLGRTLKHFLPTRTKSRRKKVASHPSMSGILRLSKKEIRALTSYTALKKNSVGYLDTSSIENSKRVLAKIIHKETAKDRQVLILVPEITMIPGLEAALNGLLPKTTIVTLHSQLAKGPYFEHWEKVRSGEAQVVIATRQGLFAPFKRLGSIMLLEEQDESYKQWDMSPRYDARRVALYLATLHQAKPILLSTVLGMESYQHIKEKAYVPLMPLSVTPPLADKLEIVNLRLERFKKNYSPLSHTLIDALRETLKHHEQAMLYIHRQGMSAFSVCEHCKNIVRCPHSGHVMNGSKDGTFRCFTCGYATGAFPSCAQCGHLAFRSIGFGTENIEREVRKLFPGARILRADGSTMRSPGSVEKLYTETVSGAVDILIGTQMILKDPTLPKLSLIAMIDADSLLSFPDFRADEKLSQILYRAVKQTNQETAKNAKKVIVQTFRPESAFFQNITMLDGRAFSDRILSERETLKYPPFSRLFSITCLGKSEKEALSRANSIHTSLENLFANKTGYSVIPPQTAKRTDIRKSFTSSLHIKAPADTPLPKNVKNFLKKINIPCIIDVDPLTLST